MPEPTPTPIPPTPTPPARPWWQGLIPTNWRELVGWLAVMLVSTSLNRWVLPPDKQLPVPDAPIPIFVPPPDGWHPPTEADTREAFEKLRTPRWRNTEAGRDGPVGDADAPVWRLAFKARGKTIPTRDQSQIGSCVSFGYAAAGEYTMGVQAALAKVRQDLPDMCQEAIYGGSRVEVNGGRVPFNGDGSTGAWGAKWLESTGGYLARGVYGSFDLTAYDVPRCRAWGNSGVPNELEPECKKHQARCTLVGSTADAKAALANGYAIAVCSGVGFDSNKNQEGKPTRDSEGFLKAQGSWGHCMAIIGYRADRPGFLILNSWGPGWVTGPKGKFDDIPDGSFWAAETDVRRMLSEQDSYAVANADGFKKRKLEPSDWIIQNTRPAPRISLLRGFDHAFALAH